MPDDIALRDLWQREQGLLRAAEAAQPALFERQPGIEQPAMLKTIGIELPGEPRPLGYLRYSPLDFLVEEITPADELISVSYDFVHRSGVVSDGQTVFADLVKANIFTLDAVKELARTLQIDEKQIGYAGIKDSNALTAQRISLRNIALGQIEQARFHNFFLQHITPGKGAIQAGDLLGNRFTIFVRTPTPVAQAALEARLAAQAATGFWNFYWVQRFGNRLLAHEWGKRLLQGRYDDAVRSFVCDSGNRSLGYYSQVRAQLAAAYGDWPQMIKLIDEQLPYTFRYERSLVAALERQPGNSTGALRAIEDQMKLWVYAYVSYLFNRMLSHYAASGWPAPAELPLLLSNDFRDREPYTKLLEADDVPLQFDRYLQPLPFLRLAHRTVPSLIESQVGAVQAAPEGVALNFTLGKGSYATTFLAHLFTLAGGRPVPEWVQTTEYDTKELLGIGSLAETKQILGEYLQRHEPADAPDSAE